LGRADIILNLAAMNMNRICPPALAALAALVLIAPAVAGDVDPAIKTLLSAPGQKGFHTVYPPETQSEFTFAESYEGKPKDGKPRTLSWIDHTPANTFGLVDLNKVLGREKEVVAYLAAEFVADRPREVQLWITCDDASKIWINGRLVAEFEVYHSGAQFDQYTARASLRQGRNLILAKVCQNAQTQDWAEGWAYQLRVCDLGGAAVLSTDRPPQKTD
jgi:hypothetical protein